MVGLECSTAYAWRGPNEKAIGRGVFGGRHVPLRMYELVQRPFAVTSGLLK